ncbi:MAG: 4-(cytidine 5'-diphospho)-2-C-methyl-D-erythritol kinase [Deltaproteobacteria bacterium]|nr:4-(cytidine 5'-diphospho)-2-C-methyl-D-erythritol kinase [Deltaproteobacteria bacterium]
MSWTLHAGCKINLYLDIVGVREDGYHELESLFYPLSEPCDTLRIGPRTEPGLALRCSIPALASSKNILAQTYDRFARATGFAPGLAVWLDKGIPMGAGLGGGSSDAAVFLRWLNDHAGTSALDGAALHGMALSLGADVPFFLVNKPAWVTGIGDTVRAVALDLSAFTMVLACPDVHVDTKWAYGRWDAIHARVEERERKSLTGDDLPHKRLCFTNLSGFRNVFEEVVFPDFPVLYKIKQGLLRSGADVCVMSGSGSSLVAIFSTRTGALQGASLMRAWNVRCHVVQFS